MNNKYKKTKQKLRNRKPKTEKLQKVNWNRVEQKIADKARHSFGCGSRMVVGSDGDSDVDSGATGRGAHRQILRIRRVQRCKKHKIAAKPTRPTRLLVSLSVYLSVHLYVWPSVSPSACLSVRLFVRQFVCCNFRHFLHGAFRFCFAFYRYFVGVPREDRKRFELVRSFSFYTWRKIIILLLLLSLSLCQASYKFCESQRSACIPCSH